MSRACRALWRRARGERGLALVVALSSMALVLVGAVIMLRMASDDRDVGGTVVAAEGAFFAADAAVNVALDMIGPDAPSCATARTQLDGGFAYQVLNTPPNRSCFAGTQHEAGYSIGTGTGYNSAGYVFYTFAFTGVGTGPRSAQRTIDVRATYGPIAQ